MNVNDIYLEQVNSHGTFTETYLSVIPCGIVVSDLNSHLTMASVFPTSSYSITASYALNGGGNTNGNIDCGNAESIYLFNQIIDCGNSL